MPLKITYKNRIASFPSRCLYTDDARELRRAIAYLLKTGQPFSVQPQNGSYALYVSIEVNICAGGLPPAFTLWDETGAP